MHVLLEKFSPIHMHLVLGYTIFVAFSECYSMKEIPGTL